MSSFLLYILYKNYCKVHVNETRSVCLVQKNKGCFSSTGTLTVKSFHPSLLFSRNLRTRKKTVYALETWTYYMYHAGVAINTRLPAGVSCRHSYGEVNGGKRREATRQAVLSGQVLAATRLRRGLWIPAMALAGPETERDGPGLVG
jgi:hypothetical protein